MCSPPTNNNISAVHDHKCSCRRLKAVSVRAAAAAFGVCDLLLWLINTPLHLGTALTTIHFINCSDVYEGLLMKGGLYGLESWRTTPQLNY